MDEKDNLFEIKQESKRLDWETPKLICLDKGKTEGGPRTGTYEDSTYDKVS